MQGVAREQWTLESLLSIAQTTPGTQNASLDPSRDVIVFEFLDQDNDLMKPYIGCSEDGLIIAALGIQMPGDKSIAATIAANEWNGEKFSRGTFSYVLGVDDEKSILALESHLLTRGGVTEESIRAWLSNFVDHINKWEEVVIGAWREIPADAKITRNRKGPFYRSRRT
jgi:hypothetical protein